MTHQVRYKLCTQENTTHNGFKLPDIGVWYSAANCDSPPRPCSNTVLHHYKHPLLAVLFNPQHANINNPKLYKIAVSRELGTDGLKGWSRKQKLVEEMQLPYIADNAKIAFAILCTKQVYKDIAWNIWADNWLSGKDRSHAAAAAARYAAAAAARYAAAAASSVAAAAAARSVVVAAATAAVAATAATAAVAATAAAAAARSVAAAAAETKLDLLTIAKLAIKLYS